MSALGKTPEAPDSTTWAAIDIGSNSFRLEIAQLRQGHYRRVDYLKETVRLGAGLDERGRLGDAASERGLKCLRGFAARLQGFDAAQVRAVATQTLREAQNRDAFLLRAREALGHPVEVISGREEARLIYAGVARLQPAAHARLVVDIGGRSTELILGQGPQALVAESFGVGCVSLSMRFFPDGRLTAQAFARAQVAASAAFEEALQPFARERWHEALGSSGTAGAVSQVLAQAGVTGGAAGGEITLAGLDWCIARCVDAGRIDKLRLPALKDDRAAVIPGGLAILRALFTDFGIAQMQPARGALRQGVIFELDARANRNGHNGTDPRDASVAELQARFKVDVAQAARVRLVACTLYDQACPSASVQDRRELAWACELHELGLIVSHHDHHRHSAYLLSHADAPGFSQNEQQRLGALVLGQRGGLGKVDTLVAAERSAWPLLCLRLAVLQCHARTAVDAQALKLSAQGPLARISSARGWSALNPRSEFLLNEELTLWTRKAALQVQLDLR